MKKGRVEKGAAYDSISWRNHECYIPRSVEDGRI